MTENFNQIAKFFELFGKGKRAALDVRKDTGEVICQFSDNKATGAQGNGTPGIPFTEKWTRVAQCDSGKLI